MPDLHATDSLELISIINIRDPTVLISTNIFTLLYIVQNYMLFKSFPKDKMAQNNF